MSGEGEPRSVEIGPGAALTAVLPLAVAAALLRSPRTLVSWHGFVHVGIAERIANAGIPPENPFFAGRPLPYYWVNQALGGALGRVLGIDPLHGLALLTLASLALLSFCALWIGARRFGSVSAGLLIGWLALAGLDPGGPAIAAAKAVRQGIPLLDFTPEPVETVFVSNESADLFMTHPLLGALYLSSDWRRGQNLVWFLDNSSRGPALALLLPLMALGLGPPTRAAFAAGAACGALSAALNPLVGLAGAGALFGGACCVAVLRSARRAPAALTASGFGVAASGLFGALLAAPTYLQVFSAAGSEPAQIGFGAAFVSKAIAMAGSFCVLAPLAAFGAWRAAPALRPRLWAVALGGLALCAAVPPLGLAEGNEHNLANAAGILLAVPALGFAAGRRPSPFASTALFAVFLPVTLCTLASFGGRPGLPIASERGVLVRMPDDDPLAELYAWIRRDTPRDAVFVVDTGHPVKMATNVSELPAFTGRALFVDQPSYLTTRYADTAARARLAADLTAGARPSVAGLATLRALARPVYLLSHAGDDEHLAERFTRFYGPPRFAAGFVAVYALAGVR